MRFGLFLVKQGIVSADQFTEALSLQMRDRVPLGQLAMESDKLTKIHVLHILSLQTKEPKLFGQIALDLKYLSKQDLADLFLEQNERLRPIGEILVELRAISHCDMESELKKYRHYLADKMDPSGVLQTVV